MTNQDMKQYSEKAGDYLSTLGEIETDMKIFMERCDKTNDMLMHQRFEAARLLLNKANEQMTHIMQITDEATLGRDVA